MVDESPDGLIKLVLNNTMPAQMNDLDTDSLLLLYLAGELTNGVKASLERRLANEPQLAAELEQLRSTHTFVADALRADDELGRLAAAESVSVRRVSRVIQQWQVNRVVTTAEPSKRGLPWWCYPTAAAAAIIIGFLVWSFRQPIGLPPVGGEATVAQNDQHDDQSPPQPDEAVAQVPTQSQNELADWMDSSFGVTADANVDGQQPASSNPDDQTMILPTPLPEETVQ